MAQKRSKQPLVANYELNSYSYTGFWTGREYEDHAERVAIRSLLPRHKVPWFIDIGGSFGRLLDEYAIRAQQIVVVDYATNDLPLSRERAQKLGVPQVHLVAANAYHLPFTDNSIDGGMMVRVMHHLEQPELFFKELQRIMRPGGYFIVEFANQYHLKAILKHLFTGDIRFFKNSPYQLPHRTDSQGIAEGQVSIIYNFSTGYLRRIARGSGLTVTAQRSVSWLRWGILKKLLPLPGLVAIESMLQALLSWTALTPSIFWRVEKPESKDTLQSLQYAQITDILVDPVSKEKLSQSTRMNQIWDLREPKPEEITY